MLSWIVGQIPWWVPWVAGVLGVGALFFFFSPVLVPLWNMTPRWVKVAGGAVLAILTAWQAGRNKGSKDAAEVERERNAAALQTRAEVDRNTASQTDEQVAENLRNRWTRDEP